VVSPEGDLVGCERVGVTSMLDAACSTLEEQAELLLASLGAHGRLEGSLRGEPAPDATVEGEEPRGEQALPLSAEALPTCREADGVCAHGADEGAEGLGISEWRATNRAGLHPAARCAACGDCRMEDGRWGCGLCPPCAVLCKACAHAEGQTSRCDPEAAPHVRRLRTLEGFVTSQVLRQIEETPELRELNMVSSLGVMAEQYLKATQLLHCTAEQLEMLSLADKQEAAAMTPLLTQIETMQRECLASILSSVRGLDHAALVFRQAETVKAAAEGTSKVHPDTLCPQRC
jgi:hypothetical protein